MTPTKPNAIRRGDTIGIVVPAGPVDRQRIDRAIGRLERQGFRTKTYGDIYRSRGYLAGDDDTRARELMDAFADPATSAVWCARGGYGVARLLDRIDYDVIRRHPKVFVGFSDITALHLAIQNRVGMVTFHGPNLQDGFGSTDELPPASKAALWQTILADGESAEALGYVVGEGGIGGFTLDGLTTGVATGQLTGGNLAVLCGLMGTPFEIDTRDRILFLEDINEQPYRVDRYLAQLSLAGKLQSAAGILLGGFAEADGESMNTDATIASVIHEYVDHLKVPVVAGFPAGHAKENCVLPMSGLIELDADHRRVSIREAAVTFDGHE